MGMGLLHTNHVRLTHRVSSCNKVHGHTLQCSDWSFDTQGIVATIEVHGHTLLCSDWSVLVSFPGLPSVYSSILQKRSSV